MKNLNKLFALLFLSLISCDKDDPTPKVIDLKADITYEKVTQISSTSGTVKIIAHVKNVGNSAFISSENQQVANLVMKIPGGNDVIIEHLDFTTVAKDGELTFHSIQDWDTTIEFPANFQLKIVYEPDIAIDSSSNNDDSNDSNNTFLLDGFALNTLFN